MSNLGEFNVKENINTLFENLEKFLVSKTVVGEAIKVGDATLIPILTVNFGLGTGGGDGQDEKGSKGLGGGAGIGASVSPTAILVIKGDNIELMPIKKHGGLEKLLEMVPDIVNKIDSYKKSEKEDKKEE